MNVFVSDNKLIIKSLADVYKIKYDFQDFISLDSDIVAVFLPKNMFAHSMTEGKYELYSFNYHESRYSIRFNVKNKPGLDFILSLTNDGNTNVINCCESNRIGQLNFYTFKSLLADPDLCYRLWLNDLMPETIKAELGAVGQDVNYDSLAKASMLEFAVDTLFTQISKKEIDYPLDTKQSFIMHLLAENDEEIQLFKRRTYFLVRAVFDNGLIGNLSYFKGTDHFANLEHVSEIQDELAGEQVRVTHHNVERKSKKAGLLYNSYDLCSIGKRRFQLDDEDTMSVLKKLYSLGYISNPVTTSRLFSPSSVYDDELSILKDLAEEGYHQEAVAYISIKGKKSNFDDYKSNEENLTYSIRPTQKIPNHYLLSDMESNFYSLIVEQYIKIFCGPYESRSLKIRTVYYSEYQMDVDKEFTTSYGHTIVDKLKKDEFPSYELYLEKERENDSIQISENTLMTIAEFDIKESSNRPPSLLTDKLILRMMEQAGKKRMTQSSKELYKDHGIGILSEREIMLKRLVTDGVISFDESSGTLHIVNDYLEKMRTGIIPDTDTIKEIYSTILAVNKDNLSFDEAYRHCGRIIKENIRKIRYREKNLNYINYSKVIKYCHCPFCENTFRENRFTLDCTYCDFKVPKEKSSRKLSVIEMIKLINNKETPVLSGFEFRNGKTGKAKLKITDEKKIVFDFKV